MTYNRRLKATEGCKIPRIQCSVYLTCYESEDRIVCKIGMSTYGGDTRTSLLRTKDKPYKLAAEVKCCCTNHAKQLERDFHILLRNRHLEHEIFDLSMEEKTLLVRTMLYLSLQIDKFEEKRKKECKTLGEIMHVVKGDSPRYDLFSALSDAAIQGREADYVNVGMLPPCRFANCPQKRSFDPWRA